MIYDILFIFFFQAEDGIRDLTVTGVQTCALPIFKVAEHAYYPFGAEINLTPHENPEEAMKFTGHERDIVAGDGHTLDYMHARYYNGALGRFLSVDPSLDLKKTLPNLQMWNRYAYVVNNSLRYTDPDGREHVNE